MIELEVVLEGLAPDKVLRLLVKNEGGRFYESQIPIAAALVPKLDDILKLIGKTVTVGVENGEIEAIEGL